MKLKKNFSCPICLKVFQTEFDFKGHITSVHGKKVLEFSNFLQNTGGFKQSFLCNICSKIFQNKYDLDSHIVSIHSDEKKKKFRCPICMIFFKTKLNVENHVSSVHERKNPKILPRPHPFSCFVCSKVLQSQDDVKKHISMVHPFRCDVCSKVFHSEAEVKIHNSTDHGIKESNNRQVHEKKQPYLCHFCPLKFDHKVKLQAVISKLCLIDKSSGLYIRSFGLLFITIETF